MDVFRSHALFNIILKSFVDLLQPGQYFRPFITSHDMAYSKLNFGQLLHKLENAEIKNKIRLYEKTKKRILLTNYVIIVNQICIYIYIYIYIYMCVCVCV